MDKFTLKQEIISFFKWLPRRMGLLIFRPFKFKEMLHTENVNCVGFITDKDKPILYGRQYKKLWFWGLIE